MASTAGYRQNKPKQGQQQAAGTQPTHNHGQAQNQSQNPNPNSQNQTQTQRPKNKWANSSNSTSNQAPRSFSNVVGNAANQQNQQNQQAPPPPSNSRHQPVHNRSASTNHQASHTSNGVSSPPLQTRMDTATSHHMHDRFLYLLACLVGHQVTVSVKGGAKYTGTFSGALTEGEFGVLLKHVRKEVGNDGSKGANAKSNSNPVIPSFIIPSKDLIDVQAEDIDLYAVDATPTKGDTFRTDAEISGRGDNQQRELRRWAPEDSETIGSGMSSGLESKSTGTWDQFAVNEQLFGTKTDYDENFYTTKLNKDRPDYAEIEKRAARIAREIETSTVSNPHMAEERNMTTDDSGLDEEDRYGAVVRGPNVYTPPAARKDKIEAPQTASGHAPTDLAAADSSVPVQAVQPVTPSSIADESGSSMGSDAKAEPAIVSTFRQWVGDEKQKYMVKKQALAKKEKDGRLADLLKFSQSFKLKTPVPQDLVPILAKDREKQEEIVQKAKSMASPKAENKTLEATSSASLQDTGSKISATVKLPGPTATSAASPATKANAAATASAKSSTPPLSPTSANAQSFKFNIKASSFKPNPKAATFAPSPLAAVIDKKLQTPPTVSSAPEAAASSAPMNPFFGANTPRKTDATLRDGFDPIRRNRHTHNPKTITPTWPYGNKSFRAQYTFSPGPAQAPYSGDDDPNLTAQAHAQQQAAAAVASMAHQAATSGHQYGMQYAYAPYGPRAGGFPASAAGGYGHMAPMAMNQAGMPYMNPAFMPGMPFSPPIPGAPPFMYSPGGHPRPPPGTSNVAAVPYYSMMPSGSPIPAAANLMPPRPMMMMGGAATPPATGAPSTQAEPPATSVPAVTES